MPPKTYRGSSVATLLAQAQAELGADAVILGVTERRSAAGEPLFEVVVGDALAMPAAPAVRTAAPPAVGIAAPAAASAVAPPPPPTVTLNAVKGPEPFWPLRSAQGDRPGQGPHVLAFVGPTGAGKTSTVAKLAAHRGVFGARTVGLLCLDTYRVGAVEQLAAYAALVERPLAVAYDASDLAACQRRLAGCDVILVDCPGRGPRAQRDSDAVAALLRRLEPRETHLVLPAGLDRAIARRTVEHHRARGVTHLLATKIDEYPDDWTLFDLAAELALPMRWLGEGQRVPQDLRSAASRLEAAQASRRGRRTRQDAVA